jgi:hypothetical protein
MSSKNTNWQKQRLRLEEAMLLDDHCPDWANFEQ